MSKNDRIQDLKISLYAENYEESDGTIAGSPNLQKVVVFDEILFEKKSSCAELDSQVLIFGTKNILKKRQRTQNNSKKRPPPRLRLTPQDNNLMKKHQNASNKKKGKHKSAAQKTSKMHQSA